MSSRGWLAAAFLAALWLLPAHAPALAADAFEVRGLEVDVTAPNVAAAKQQAIAEAERVGFRRLLERLTQPTDHGRLPNADAAQYVRDFAVEQERSSTVRYIATLTVRYNAVAVKKLLQGASLKYADPRPRPVVVVPVFKAQGASKAVLWEDSNPWRAAWGVAGTGALVPIALPSGETADPLVLSADKALANDGEALAALGARFRTADVMVATAAVNAQANTLDVSLSGSSGSVRPFEVKSYPLAEAGLDTTLRAAVHDIAQGLDAVYKQGNMLSFDRASTLAVMAPLKGMEDWLALRERLGRVTLVRRWEIVSLSRDEAALVLHTLGEAEQVKAALSGAGLVMDWNGSFWTMRTR